MLFPTLFSAGFALTTNAFLLPPEAARTFEAAKNSIAPNAIDPLSRSVTLDCSDCPYALESQRNGHHEWTNSVKSDLQLRFTSEDNKLKLNGVPFYPITPPFTPAPLAAKQIKKDDEEKFEGYTGDLRLSYSLEIDNEKKHFPVPGQEAILSEMTLSIMGLDNEVIHVDDIKIKALSIPNSANAQHELIIVSVDTKPTDNSDAQCGTIICRVMHKFKGAVRKAQAHAKTAAHKVKCFCVKCIHNLGLAPQHHQFRPTHSRYRPAASGQAGNPSRLPTHHVMRPGQFKTHHQSHFPHPHPWAQTFARATKQFFSFVLLPIIVGVVFGIAASAIGMLVGQLIVAVWLRLRRNNSRSVSYEPVETEEKEGLPKYEDLDNSQTVTDEKV
ncbi:MAG: hypothetical protein L6R38_007371 [Xanthoria sp. 2 TBL-2021]|nr:MAG: hypothetical protein L6R38_007371 [Xanthoria sp. 2 TBL-2021]